LYTITNSWLSLNYSLYLNIRCIDNSKCSRKLELKINNHILTALGYKYVVVFTYLQLITSDPTQFS